MKKILVDVDGVTGEETPLIILKDTGVLYTAQCGGIGCSRPNAEGYVLGLGNFAQAFDDCSFGCSYISQDPKMQNDLAKAFDEYCVKYWKGCTGTIRFDFERISETQEGWIPVIVNGTLNGVAFENAKGIIHNGNCD